LKYYSAYKHLKGNQNIQITKGYKSVFEAIISNKSEAFDERLKLNHVLKKIYVCRKLLSPQLGSSLPCTHCSFTNDENKIVLVVTTKSAENNQEEEKLFICDNVLCTMSLGYLKHNITNLIEPIECVPEEKLVSIQRLGFGTVNKFMLVYEKPFWDENLSFMAPVRHSECWSSQVENLRNDKMYKTDWLSDMSSFDTYAKLDNVLVAWMNQNSYYESLDDKTVMKEAHEHLKKFLGRNDIPEPKQIIR